MSDSPWLSPDQQYVWRQYLQVTRLIAERTEKQLHRDSGMPQAYYLVLAMLSEAPGRSLRMNQLADVLNASQSRTSHAVARLEEQGWVRRVRTECDGRGQTAMLTDEGWEQLVKASPGHASTVKATMFEPLDEDDLAALRRAFDKITGCSVFTECPEDAEHSSSASAGR